MNIYTANIQKKQAILTDYLPKFNKKDKINFKI